jgi:hypothetical protein
MQHANFWKLLLGNFHKKPATDIAHARRRAILIGFAIHLQEVKFNEICPPDSQAHPKSRPLVMTYIALIKMLA